MSMDANFSLVHKKTSGKGAGLENTRHGNQKFSDDKDVYDFVESHSVSKTSSSVSTCISILSFNVLFWGFCHNL